MSTVQERVLRAHQALSNGSGRLDYFQRRGLLETTIKDARIGYEAGSFLYPCRAANGDLLGVHHKSERRDERGKRKQWWSSYSAHLPLKANGEPAKIIPWGLDTLQNLESGSLVILCCGEEDALSLRQAGYTALSQPGAGLLEPVYARKFAGFEVVVFYDAGEEDEAHKDALKLKGAGATEVRVVEWPPEVPHGADVNGRLIEKSSGFEEWAGGMVAAAPSVSRADAGVVKRVGEPDRYGGFASRNVKVSSPVGQLLSEVRAEPVKWLWPGRIPRGKLTLIEGDPDTGKSTLTMGLAAHVSTGRRWPDGTPCEMGGAVLLNAEDGLADTIKPRLEAAGGDASKVLGLATVQDGASERTLSIPEDLDIIRRGIERVEAKVVVVDPFMAFLSGDVNSHRDQDVRRALARLSKLAEETGVAVVVVRHLNKTSGGNPLYRGGGSIGIVGAARAALLVAKHPEDRSLRVLARVKGNLAAPAPSLTFALTDAANGAVRMEWKGETTHTADVLLAAPTDPEERSALDEAKEFLRDVLRGGPRGSNTVKKEARDADIAEITLKRAKAALGVRSRKDADGSWSWRLPESEKLNGDLAP